jgi:hypothetical protein
LTQDLISADQVTKISGIGLTTGDAGSALVPAHLGEVVTFATLMSRADCAVPPHLRENPGACLAVCMRAFRLNWDPFALAAKTYLVQSKDGTVGQIAYEAQAIAAMINTSPVLARRPRYEYIGDGQNRQCKVTFNTRDGDELEYLSPKLGSITPKRSPLWQSDPDQQQGYYSVRAGARRHFPEIIMGVYDREEMMERIDEVRTEATSFEVMEARAATVALPAPEERKPDPKPAKAAAGPATRTEAAKPASEPSTEKAAGSAATGADTGQARTADRAAEEPADGREQDDGFPGDRARDQPQEVAERPAARDLLSPDLLKQALEETLNVEVVDVDAQEGDAAAGDEADEPPEEDADGFGAFAATCAGAKDWPTIKAGLLALSRTQAWAEAAPLMHQKVRAMAFHRLQETVNGGYKFDFIRDPHAYRCSIEFFQDEDVLAGNRKTVVGMDWWMPLTTEAKEKFDLAFHTRIRALRETREFA